MAPRQSDGESWREADDEWTDNENNAAAAGVDDDSMLHRGIVHVPTNEEEALHVDAVHGVDSWESRVLHVLHGPKIELMLAGLLLLDVVILFVELFLGASYPPCSVVTRDAVSCCPAYADMYGGDDDHRFLAEAADGDASGSASSMPACGIAIDEHDDDDHTGYSSGSGGGGHFLRALLRSLAANAKEEEEEGGHGHGHHSSVCEAGLLETACPAGCDDHQHAAIHSLHTVLFSMTIAILGIFLLELSLLIICLKPKVFFRKPFYVLDLVVVTTSLALELGFYFSNNEAVAELAGLLIFARLWRFVRIGHGIIEVTNEYHGQKHGKIIQYNKQLEELLVKNGIDVPEEVQRGMKKLKRLDSVVTEAADGADDS